MRPIYSAIAAILATGCAAGPEYFLPTERVLAQSESGTPEAVYTIVLDNQRVGEAKVWSPGANEVEGRTVVHAAIEVANTSDRPLSVDLQKTWLQGVVTDEGAIERVPVTSAVGDTTVPPQAVRQVRIFFTLPANVSTQEVDAFRLHWSVSSAGRAYTQFTPFVEDEWREYAYWYGPEYGYAWGYGPFYDPFYDPFFPYAYYGPWPGYAGFRRWPGYYGYVRRPGAVVRVH